MPGLPDVLATLRQFLRARWEEGDEVLFRTKEPLRQPPPALVAAPAAAPVPARFTPRPPAHPLPPREPAPVRGAKSAPAPQRHPSGIINPGRSDKGKALLAHYEEIHTCTKCPLGKGRLNFVFGTGSATAQVVFVGEAPGEQEDKQGLPFVGPAGKLLTDLLEAVGLSRDQVFICNVIKCRPPNNRKPELEEVETCEPYLFEQLKLIAPKLVVALGTFAAQSLLQTTQPIGRLRGRWMRWRDAEMLATYHPSAALRATAFRRVIEEDFQLLKTRLVKLPPPVSA